MTTPILTAEGADLILARVGPLPISVSSALASIASGAAVVVPADELARLRAGVGPWRSIDSASQEGGPT